MEPRDDFAEPEAPRRPVWRPWVTYGLIAVSALLFLVTAYQSRTLGDQDTQVLVEWGGGYPVWIWSRGEYWRLFAQMWLHGGWWHVATNMYALYVLGPLCEVMFGRLRFLYIYLAGGVVASLVSLLFADPNQLSVGASGAVLAVFGALIFFKLADRRRGQALQWQGILINLGLLLGVGIVFQGYIDNWAHAGGVVGGFAVAALVGLQPVPGWDGRPGRTPLWRAAVAGLLGLVLAALLAGLLNLPGINGAPYVAARQGFVALEHGDLQGARDRFGSLLQLDPYLGEAHYGMAEVAFSEGDYQEAARRLLLAFQLTPDSDRDPRYLHLYARIREKIQH
jgi:rhomboid protease GluP